MAQSPEQDESEAVRRLARKLKGLRRNSGLSLIEVAEATNMSRSFVSMVESGRSDISMGRLMKLLKLYNAKFSDLAPPPSAPDSAAVVIRREERPKLGLTAENLSLFGLAHQAPGRVMMPMLAEYLPESNVVDHLSHEGEEFIFVLSGALEIDFGEGGALHLRKEDSAYFDATQPHLFRSTGKRVTRVLGVATPPSM